MTDELPLLEHANAHYVTEQLLVGGDLAVEDEGLSRRQIRELVELGVTFIIDARAEWSDEELLARVAPEVGYLHLGIDDAGQRVPDSWFDQGVAAALKVIDGGGAVLTHCHMGINRGPSLGVAVLLAQGWDPVEALDAIHDVRPIAFAAYAEDAWRWHCTRQRLGRSVRKDGDRRIAQWRRRHDAELDQVVRRIRSGADPSDA